MNFSCKRDFERLCYAKLYELELIEYAEDKARAESEKMADMLVSASLKTLGDCRALLKHSRRTPMSLKFKPRARRLEDALCEICSLKEKWIESARKYAFEVSGSEKELLLRICDCEYDEIQKIKRCM